MSNPLSGVGSQHGENTQVKSPKPKARQNAMHTSGHNGYWMGEG